jgi:hypothetical protein
VNATNRLLWILGPLTVGLVALAQNRPYGFECFSKDAAALKEAQIDIETAHQTRVKLDHQNAVVLQRCAAKAIIIRDLIEGRLTLVQAAGGFHDLNRANPDVPNSIELDPFPDASEGESLCRQVISWVKAERGGNRSPQASSVIQDLEAQLQDLLKRDGTAHLNEN